MLNDMSIIEQIKAIAGEDVPQQTITKIAELSPRTQEAILEDMIMGWSLSQALNCEVKEKY